jgi:chromate reductase
MRLLTISGSLRAGSYNTALARAVADVAPEGVEVEPFEGLGELPLYDADLEGDDHPAVRHLRRRIAGADAVLFVTPEYNGSIPGVLKNAVDWASRPRDNAALRGKTAAVAGASTGQFGALWAQQDLRRVLGIAGARVVCPELPVARAQDVCDETGGPSPLVAERLRIHVAELVREAERAREAEPVAVAA